MESSAAHADLVARSRGRLTTDTAHLVVRTVFQQVLGLGRGLLLPNILGPLHYGSLATILLVERYATHVNLGIHSATLYQVPPLLARGARADARRIHDNVVGFSLLMGVLSGAILAVWAWAFRDRLAPELVAGLLVAAMLPPLIALRGALTTWVRANGDFSGLGRGGIVTAVVLFALTIGFGFAWRSAGVIAGHVVAYAVLIGYLCNRPGSGFHPALRPRAILDLLRASAPMTVLSLLMIYLLTVDRLTIASTLSVEDVGYYAIGQLLASALLLVPNAVGEAMSPTLIADAHDATSPGRLAMSRITTVMAITVALAAASLISVLPGVLPLVFARYAPAIPAAQLLCLAAYFEAVGLGAHYVVSSRSVRGYILYTILLIGFALVILPVLGRRQGITAVAGGIVVLTAARTLWLSWRSRRLTGTAPADALREVGLLLLIGVTAGAVPLGLQVLLPQATGGVVPALVESLGRLAATLAVLILLAAVCMPAQLRVTLSMVRRTMTKLGAAPPDDDAPAGAPGT